MFYPWAWTSMFASFLSSSSYIFHKFDLILMFNVSILSVSSSCYLIHRKVSIFQISTRWQLYLKIITVNAKLLGPQFFLYDLKYSCYFQAYAPTYFSKFQFTFDNDLKHPYAFFQFLHSKPSPLRRSGSSWNYEFALPTLSGPLLDLFIHQLLSNLFWNAFHPHNFYSRDKNL